MLILTLQLSIVMEGNGYESRAGRPWRDTKIVKYFAVQYAAFGKKADYFAEIRSLADCGFGVCMNCRAYKLQRKYILLKTLSIKT